MLVYVLCWVSLMLPRLPAASFLRHCLAATIGVMVTASHNPEPDNGVKIVDPMGEMMEESWEAHATALANCPNKDLPAMYVALAGQLGVNLSQPAHIVLAMDTRPSSAAMAAAVIGSVA